MSGYPHSDDDQLVDSQRLRSFVASVFESCGMSSQDALLLSDSLVVADLRGCHSHGVLRVPDYVKKLTREGVDPGGAPRVIREHAAGIVVDGNNSMGQIACAYAMQQAIHRARETSVSVASVRGSNHCGAMAYFAMMPLAEDMIGFAATNALPTMAPWGGCERIVGINPLAVAIPAGHEYPLVFDAAFSGSSHGKIRVYHQKGLDIPEGWAFGRDGLPTTSAEAAIDGLLQPIGGYKGVGLAIVMGVLSSVLSGAAYGTELGNMEEGPEPGKDGQFLMAISVSAFEDVDVFRERIDGIIRQIRDSRRTSRARGIYAPGGLEAETETRYREEGIPLNRVTVDGLLACASECEVDADGFPGGQ